MRSGAVMLGLAGAVAAGCGFRAPAEAIDSGGAGSDQGAGDGCASFATLLDTCQLAFDRDLVVTGASTYDATSQTLTIAGVPMQLAIPTVVIGGAAVDVLSARNVQLAPSATLRATGAHALAIVASGMLTIAGDAQLDVGDGGAGAQAACAGGAVAGESSTGGNRGGAGGGGGGFGADGGDGGGGNGDATQTHGGMHGHAVAAVPDALRGGCPGGPGGAGDASGGAGGAGGGAVYLVAVMAIQLDSTAPIRAAGGGGRGGQHGSGGDAGGGGGGSGGLVILEAPHILGTGATVTANGGGGGGGSDSGTAGLDGNPGTLTTGRADGGGGAASGAGGGLGGSRDTPTGDSVTELPDGGGGGGGGGVGIIRILSADVHLGAISPAPR